MALFEVEFRRLRQDSRVFVHGTGSALTGTGAPGGQGTFFSLGDVGVGFAPMPCACRKLRRGWSGGISVLVDESATAGRFHDLEVSIWLVCSVGGDGWSLIE